MIVKELPQERREQVAKCVAMLASPNDAAATARRCAKILKAAELDQTDFAGCVANVRMLPEFAEAALRLFLGSMRKDLAAWGWAMSKDDAEIWRMLNQPKVLQSDPMQSFGILYGMHVAVHRRVRG